jgi:hypothetical protein
MSTKPWNPARTPRACETPTFCFRCGGPVTSNQYCKTCGISWERLYVVRCPRRPDEFSWVHLFPPTAAVLDKHRERVVKADGFALCEACEWRPHLYEWDQTILRLDDRHGWTVDVPLEDVRSE